MREKKINTYHFTRGVFIAGLLVLVLLFNSCKSDENYQAQIKSLDSLSVAVSLKMAELKQVDTVTLEKAIFKFSNYRQFIKQNVLDTLTREEGDVLQQFYLSGKNLMSFEENRKNILARGALINSQISRLIRDAKQSAIEEETFFGLAGQEKMQADNLVKIIYEQQQIYQSNLEQFKGSLTGVEALIKSRNNGQLPTIVKDSIPL